VGQQRVSYRLFDEDLLLESSLTIGTGDGGPDGRGGNIGCDNIALALNGNGNNVG